MKVHRQAAMFECQQPWLSAAPTVLCLDPILSSAKQKQILLKALKCCQPSCFESYYPAADALILEKELMQRTRVFLVCYAHSPLDHGRLGYA